MGALVFDGLFVIMELQKGGGKGQLASTLIFGEFVFVENGFQMISGAIFENRFGI
jgi:hypothetical protein